MEEGTRLEPVAVECHFIGLGSPVSEPTREWCDDWWARASEKAEGADPPLRVLPNNYHDGSKMDLKLYDDLVFLDWF